MHACIMCMYYVYVCILYIAIYLLNGCKVRAIIQLCCLHLTVALQEAELGARCRLS